MSATLAAWLATHQPTILEHWRAALVADGAATLAIPTTLDALYAALVSAARGNAPDDASWLPLAHRGADGQGLVQLLRLPASLRRACWQVANSTARPTRRLALLSELDALLDRFSAGLAQHYEQELARSLQQRLEEAEFMTTQLAMASEEADAAALRISRLYAFSQALSRSLNLQDLIATIGQELQAALGADRCAIWLCAEEHVVHAHSWGYAQPLPVRQYALHDRSLVPQALQRSEPWVLEAPCAEQDGGWIDPDAAVLALPLIAGDHRLGVIIVQSGQRSFAAEQTALAQSLANQAALALESAGLYDQLKRLNAELEQRIEERTRELRTERDRLDLLFTVSSTVSSTLDVDQMLAELLEILRQRLRINHGSVMLLDAETAQLEQRATLGARPAGLTRLPLGVGIAGWVAQHATPLLVEDVRRDPRWVAPESDAPHHKQGGSLLAVPLIASDEVLGVLQVSHPDVGHFNQEHLRLLTVIANEAAVAIHNAALYRYISDQATQLAAMVRAERASSSRSQAILQSIADGVIVCDCDGQVILANPASARILDQPLEELFLQNLHAVLHHLDLSGPERAPLRTVLEAPLDDGQPRQYRTRFRIGPRTIDMTLGPVLTEGGDLLGGVATLRDISREIEADRLKTEFIGTVSHELRTPMTVIKGYLQLLTLPSTGELSPFQQQLVTTIAANAERMTSLINDLLDITKIESGSVELEFKPIDVARAIDLAVSGQQALLEQRNHRLTLEVAPDLPPILADGARFHQVLDNLLSNAIKYTHRGGQITIRAHQVTRADLPPERSQGLASRRPYVAIAISDTGIGIAPEDQERVWERFYRVESELKVEAGGTGLGLALVRSLTQLMGGRVWLESTPGQGSTFTLLLPTA